MNTAFCAICTHNYFNYSKLLFDSLKSVGHQGEFFLLIIDYQKEYSQIISSNGINIITLESLQIPEINELIERYNPFELCNVLKPYFLEWVLNNNKDLSTVIYLDSDIYVYNPFDDVIKYLKDSTSSILLVPNFTGKSKLLGETDYYEETIFFRAGLYCGGFYALKNDENSRSFLKWHKLKLRKFGYNAPGECMFVDQKILDLAPLLFDFVSIYKNESYNVGHWNYKENPLTFVNNRYYINNKPLVFFHFSYLKIDINDESKDVLLNIQLIDDPILHDLCKDYWRKLINLPNYSKIKGIKYGHVLEYKPRHTAMIEDNKPVIDEFGNLKYSIDELTQKLLKVEKKYNKAENEINRLNKILQGFYNSKSLRLLLFFSNIRSKFLPKSRIKVTK